MSGAPSPELMNMVNGGMKGAPPMPAGAPGAPPAAAAGPGGPGGNAPVSAPMSTPEPKQGDKQNAMINVSLAMDLLEQSLPALGSESEEGRVVLNTLSGLSKKFGHSADKSKELVPAELMQMMQNLPQLGGMSPEMKALQAHGMPGMAPPGAPPGGAPAGMPPKPPGMQ